MQPNEILVVTEADDDARPVAVRVPRPANEAAFAGTGPARGAYEAWADRFAHQTGRYPCVLIAVPTWGRKRAA